MKEQLVKTGLVTTLLAMLSLAVHAQQPERKTVNVKGVAFNMVRVEGGTFMMGAKDEAHRETVSTFFIGETEVTQELWEVVMRSNPSEHKGYSLPVEDISWDDCQVFVRKLKDITGLDFRLPTTVEWEYAARGGKNNRGCQFAGSDELKLVAWNHDNSGGRPHPVGTLYQNELGLFDMSGNVNEWNQDAKTVEIGGVDRQYRAYSGGDYDQGRGTVIWEVPYYVWSHSAAPPDLGRSKTGLRLAVGFIPTDYRSKPDGSLNPVLKRLIDNMVLVEGGSFMMGETKEQALADKYTYNEKATPVHKVFVSSFRMGKYELSQEEWYAVMGTNISSFNYSGKYPANGASWEDTQVFLRRLNSLTGLEFRLPTEAEWEYAARGGKKSRGYRYSGSNRLEEVAWARKDGQHEVGACAPNELGLYDMSGNVNEWCQDWYGEYTPAIQYNPTGPSMGTERVYRGGAYAGVDDYWRVADRKKSSPNYRDRNIGIRLVLPVESSVSVEYPAPEVVDMGLSVKWASWNLGASSPEGTGFLFAWGETKPKAEFSMDSYKWAKEKSKDLYIYTKDFYHTEHRKDSEDGRKVLEPEDDAAHVNLGGKWRIPSAEEWNELMTKCDWTWTSMNGISGYRVTSRVNKKSIFLPATYPESYTRGFDSSRAGDYWTNSLKLDSTSEPSTAYYFSFYVDNRSVGGYFRERGNCVRPVYDGPVPAAPPRTVEPSTSEPRDVESMKAEVIEVTSYATPKIVDLGLSVKWSSFNLGASRPEEYGRYYAWGETGPKKDYSWYSYKWCKYDAQTLTKYCPNPSYGFNGFSDKKTVLDPEDDAAHVRLGDKWRIPTEEEYRELLAKCTQEWVQVNGVVGVRFTSKVNGNSIFLPATGVMTERGGLTGDGEGGSYISSSVLREGGLYKEYCLNLRSGSARDGSSQRRDGCPIRPVYGDPKPSAGQGGKAEQPSTPASSGMVDLGLSVKWASCNVGAKAPEEFGNYYAWGETAPKSTYSWGTYKWSGPDAQSLTKYCETDGFGQNGYKDAKKDLDPEDDAARANLGEGWRMPTEQEIKELQDNCSWEWTELNKVPGFKVTSLKNGNSIFIPAAGRATNRGQAEVRVSLYYWARSLNKAFPQRPDLAGGISRRQGSDAIVPTRCTGCTVRAVYDR